MAARIVSFVVAAGTTLRGTFAQRIATGTLQAIATIIWGFASSAQGYVRIQFRIKAD